tara:strand:- start:627 stop:1046 length:420 start_codon:yes stop_codon:yes gene_type:complete
MSREEDEGPAPITIEDLAYVLPKAVEAYRAAAIRDRPKQVGYIAMQMTPEEVVERFPDFFCLYCEGKLQFIGETAEEILETYLTGLGYERCSQKWFELAHVVVNMAVEEGRDIESIVKEVRPTRTNKNRARNSKPPKVP